MERILTLLLLPILSIVLFAYTYHSRQFLFGLLRTLYELWRELGEYWEACL